MCGITGFTQPPDNAAPILSRMMKAIAHRGPDDKGQWIDSEIGLGHQRLSIIDLQTGHQPMSNADQTLWIVFNGEIYNYVELKERLSASGALFHSHSDTEVILRLYEQYGESCVDHLNGMFAFLIYDKRQNRLFAARDRFGMKPFYYIATRERFLFASEIKALFQYPEITPRLNPRALAEYTHFQFCMGSKTLFEGVLKLEPAHTLTYGLHDKSCRIREYWRPVFQSDDAQDETSALQELAAIVKDSVRMQMRSDVPIGSYLSGGLDSSLVTCLAADATPKTLKTFTGGFREPGPFNESAHARTVVASRRNMEYHDIFAGPQDFIDAFPKLIYHMDEPAAGPGLYAQYMVSTLAARHVKVVLGGQGGDEVFGGYARYFLLHLHQTLRRGGSFPFADQRHGLGMIWKNRHLLWSYLPTFQRLMASPSRSPSAAGAYFDLINRSGPHCALLNPDLHTARYAREIHEEYLAQFDHVPKASAYERAAYFDFKTLLPALLHVEDRVSMAVSLESRAPLLDHRLVERVATLSPEIRFKNGELKYLLKKIAAPIVPAPIVGRKDKIGFAVPFVQWAKGPLRPYLQDLFTSRQSRSRGLLNTEKILNCLGKEQRFGRDLWGALCLETWCSTFLDPNHRGDPL